MQLPGQQDVPGHASERDDDVVLVGEPGGGGRAAQRGLLLRSRLKQLACTSEWEDWGFRCTLVPDHAGAHVDITEERVAYWGAGGPSTWTRA